MGSVHLPPFSTAALLDELRDQGVHLRLVDGAPRAKFTETCPATPALIEELKARREEIVEILLAHEPATVEVKPATLTPMASKFDGLSQRIDQERREQAALGEARRLIRLCRTNGAVVALQGDQVSVRGWRPDEETCARLKAHKSALVEVLASESATA